MPELPEVEIFRQVADSCRGRAINQASIADPGILEGIPAQDLERRLKGESLRSSRRHGKHLFLELSAAGTLAMHFGMNGSLKLVSESEPDPSYARLQLYFEKGDRLVTLALPRTRRRSSPKRISAPTCWTPHSILMRSWRSSPATSGISNRFSWIRL